MDLASLLVRRVERLEECCENHKTKIRELEGILRRSTPSEPSPPSGASFPNIRSTQPTPPTRMMATPVPEHIPNRQSVIDPRKEFFKSQSELYQVNGQNPATHYLNVDGNSTKYYYRKIGEKLEPLGKFKKLIRPNNQHQGASWNGIYVYTIFFDKAQIESEGGDKLYYTDTPPERGGSKTRKRNKKI